MQSAQFLNYLLLLLLTSITLEGMLLALRRSANWHPAESLVNFVLGISNLAVGVLFVAIHLAVYGYIQAHWSLQLDFGNYLTNIAIAFLAYDFLYWVSHWTHHKCALLWCNHLIHHSGTAFNLTTAVRIGWLGNFTVWLFFLPMAMLGIPVEHYLLVISAQLIYQFFIHTTLVGELGVLEWVLVTPSQHRVHHASNDTYLDKNFGCFLVIWDQLFGTYQRELPQEPVRYGVTTPIIQTGSPGYLNFFMYVHCWRSARAARGLGAKLRVLFGNPTHTEMHDTRHNPTPVNEQSWFDYLPVLFLGFYLVTQYESLPTGDAILAATVFLLAANSAGHRDGYVQAVRWPLRIGQTLACLYLWWHAPAGGWLLVLASLTSFLPFLANLCKFTAIKE